MATWSSVAGMFDIVVITFIAAGVIALISFTVRQNFLFRREEKRRASLPKGEQQKLREQDEVWRQRFQP